MGIERTADMGRERTGFLVIPASNYGIREDTDTVVHLISLTLQGEHRTALPWEKVPQI